MLELIIALFLSLGIISNADQLNDQLIQDHQDSIKTHIVDDDIEIG